MGSYAKNINAYKEQSVNTMTNIEMLTTLYNQILKHLNRMKICIKNDDMKLLDIEGIRAREVIQYLIDTLDKEYDVSKNLSRLYEYMQFEIARINASRKIEIIDEVVTMVTELKDTFILASKSLGGK